MKTRLLKEIRLIWVPFLLASVVPPVVFFLFRSMGEVATGFFLALLPFIWGCLLLPSCGFASEFSLGSETHLLAQPIPRFRIWGEKFLVSAVAMVLLGVIFFTELDFFVLNQLSPGPLQEPETEWRQVKPFIVLAMALAVAGGPFWGILIRQVIGAAILSMITPCVLAGATVWWFEWNLRPTEAAQSAVLHGVTLYGLALIPAGAWLWQRFQAKGQRVGESFFERFESSIHYHARNASWNFVIKELRLHLPALAICLGLLALEAGFGVAGIRKTWPAEMAVMLSSISAFLLPLLFGTIPPCDERRLGVLPVNLVLQGPPQRSWMLRVGVAWFLTLALANVAQVLVILAIQAGHPDMRLELPGSGYGPGAQMGVSAAVQLLICTFGLFVGTYFRTSVYALIFAACGSVFAVPLLESRFAWVLPWILPQLLLMLLLGFARFRRLELPRWQAVSSWVLLVSSVLGGYAFRSLMALG